MMELLNGYKTLYSRGWWEIYSPAGEMIAKARDLKEAEQMVRLHQSGKQP